MLSPSKRPDRLGTKGDSWYKNRAGNAAETAPGPSHHAKGRAMITRADITPDFLRQVLHYDPETGNFRWKSRTREVHPDDRTRQAFNTRSAGNPAGVLTLDTGYVKIKIRQVPVYAHRAAYAIMTGEWPSDEVDHINGDRMEQKYDELLNAIKSFPARGTGR